MDKNLHQNAKAPMIALILFNLFAFSMIAKSQTALCAPEDLCQITYVLHDSYGNGWNGNFVQVVDTETSTVLAEWTFNNGLFSQWHS